MSLLTIDEWEQEFGGGCCFKLHGIVMDTGKAVYDWTGAPEDYALRNAHCTDL
jgi:hypothetical protein